MNIMDWLFQHPWTCIPAGYLCQVILLIVVLSFMKYTNVDEDLARDDSPWYILPLACLFWLPGVIWIKLDEAICKIRYG